MEFEVTISKAFLKKSHFRRLFKNWWQLLIAFILIIWAVIIDSTPKGMGATQIAGLSVAGLCIIIYVAVWVRQLRVIRDWESAQGAVPVKYRLSDTEVEAESLIGSTKLKWAAFKCLRIQKHDTLLEFKQVGALTLPTDQLSDETVEYLIDRFASNGLKVINSLDEQGASKT